MRRLEPHGRHMHRREFITLLVGRRSLLLHCLCPPFGSANTGLALFSRPIVPTNNVRFRYPSLAYYGLRLEDFVCRCTSSAKLFEIVIYENGTNEPHPMAIWSGRCRSAGCH